MTLRWLLQLLSQINFFLTFDPYVSLFYYSIEPWLAYIKVGLQKGQ